MSLTQWSHYIKNVIFIYTIFMGQRRWPCGISLRSCNWRYFKWLDQEYYKCGCYIYFWHCTLTTWLYSVEEDWIWLVLIFQFLKCHLQSHANFSKCMEMSEPDNGIHIKKEQFSLIWPYYAYITMESWCLHDITLTFFTINIG